MRALKVISLLLGILMTAFGTLKFVNPFATWYRIQLEDSGLDRIYYWPGISAEIFTGLVLLFGITAGQRLSANLFKVILATGSIVVAGIMIVAIYVHLQPNVPREVLPLKIKLPYIPVSMLLLAVVNVYLVRKHETDR
jgi:hypothetical protein